MGARGLMNGDHLRSANSLCLVRPQASLLILPLLTQSYCSFDQLSNQMTFERANSAGLLAVLELKFGWAWSKLSTSRRFRLNPEYEAFVQDSYRSFLGVPHLLKPRTGAQSPLDGTSPGTSPLASKLLSISRNSFFMI